MYVQVKMGIISEGIKAILSSNVSKHYLVFAIKTIVASHPFEYFWPRLPAKNTIEFRIMFAIVSE